MAERIKQIDVSPELIVDLLKKGEHKFNVKKGLPDDIILYDCWYDKLREVFTILVRHDSFEIVTSYCNIPRVDIKCERID